MEFTLRTKVNASAKAIYEAWLSSEGHTKMTGGEAEASDKIGERFIAWDGYIEGINIELVPNERIVQSWRSSQFDDNEMDSKIEVVLKESDDQTELILTHSKIPEDGDHYKRGWEEHYFTPMRAYFSGEQNAP